ncbi:MAG: hypothetical protein AAF721_38070 [Myxococcota bacterium]
MRSPAVVAFLMLVSAGCPTPPRSGSAEGDAATTSGTEATDLTTSTGDSGDVDGASTALPRGSSGTTQGTLDDSGSAGTTGEALTSSGSETGSGGPNGYPQCRGAMGECPRDHVCVAAPGGRFCAASCNVAGDCPVPPTGTALRACTEVSTPMGLETYCVLTCGRGETCPVGLTCGSLGLCLYPDP